jgi:hypothetical protein
MPLLPADESRPAEAFTTERAVRSGRANAASGRIMVNVPNDHFGPILPEHDPVNGKVSRGNATLVVATNCGDYARHEAAVVALQCPQHSLTAQPLGFECVCAQPASLHAWQLLLA